MASSPLESDVPPIILDSGSSCIKAGFADEDVPRTISDAVAGSYYPIDRGYIKEISHVEIIWADVFNFKLDADPSLHGVMLTEPILNPISNAKKYATSMFETFSCPFISTAPGPIMALYASGRDTGVTLNVGGGLTQCIPIVDGYPLLQRGGSAITQSSYCFGGKD